MKGIFIGFGIFGVFLILVLILFTSAVGVKNTCVKFEKKIEAVHRNMENIHSNTYKKIAQKANVSKDYSKQLREMVKEYVQGRGSNAKMFSMVKEAIPTLSPDLHKNIMNTIEEGNNEFKVAQTEKIELINQYEVFIESGIIRPMIVSTFGYPKIDSDEYKEVISVKDTKKVFETKEDVVQEVF